MVTVKAIGREIKVVGASEVVCIRSLVALPCEFGVIGKGAKLGITFIDLVFVGLPVAMGDDIIFVSVPYSQG